MPTGHSLHDDKEIIAYIHECGVNKQPLNATQLRDKFKIGWARARRCFDAAAELEKAQGNKKVSEVKVASVVPKRKKRGRPRKNPGSEDFAPSRLAKSRDVPSNRFKTREKKRVEKKRVKRDTINAAAMPATPVKPTSTSAAPRVAPRTKANKTYSTGVDEAKAKMRAFIQQKVEEGAFLFVNDLKQYGTTYDVALAVVDEFVAKGLIRQSSMEEAHGSTKD